MFKRAPQKFFLEITNAKYYFDVPKLKIIDRIQISSNFILTSGDRNKQACTNFITHNVNSCQIFLEKGKGELLLESQRIRIRFSLNF